MSTVLLLFLAVTSLLLFNTVRDLEKVCLLVHTGSAGIREGRRGGKRGRGEGQHAVPLLWEGNGVGAFHIVLTSPPLILSCVVSMVALMRPCLAQWTK